MPNWCYTTASFKGKPENILRLANDIYKSIEWMRNNNYSHCNIGYFFSLNGFDIKLYNKNYPKNESIQLRCSIAEDYPLRLEYYGSFAVIYPIFESAWYMDYNILHLISLIYNVEFSAYSEEPNMDLFAKCKNGFENTYDYDYVLRLDPDAVDEILEYDSNCDLDYNMAIKENDPHTKFIMNEIKENNIEYTKETIYNDHYGSTIHGVYYDV